MDAHAFQMMFDKMGMIDSVEPGRGEHMRASSCLLGWRDQLLFALLSCGQSVGGSVFGAVRSFNCDVIQCSVIQSLVLSDFEVCCHRLVVSHWPLSLWG